MNKNYELYVIVENKNSTEIKYYVKTRNGFRFSTAKATEFEYEEAVQIQSENTELELMICNEDEEDVYFYNTKYDFWKRYIAEDDELADDKHHALDAACDLCYSDATLEAIINATTIGEINRAMRKERIA